MRGAPKQSPDRLTGPHDGTTLEQVIGELQSEHGVPQHPQEYRITLRVADVKGDKATVVEDTQDPETKPQPAVGGPSTARDGNGRKREKAPAAPRIRAGGDGEAAAASSSNGGAKRKRSRRRRRRSKGTS